MTSSAAEPLATAAPAEAPPDAGLRRWVLPGSTALAGGALALLVVLDGSPAGQVLRVVLVLAVTAGLTVAIDRAGARVRGVVAFLAGAVFLAVGAGMGLPHLAKGGPALVTAAGLVLLVAGAVLVVGGGAAVVRSFARWHGLLVAPLLLIGVVVVLLTIGPAVAATNVPPTSVGSATPADRGHAYTDVELPTRDGVTLSGWYIPSTNGTAVALLHGAGSTRSNVLPHADALAARGYGVLLFDARGHGNSGGRAMDFGWYGDEDIAAAVDFLAEQPEVEAGRIAAVGMSMGGEEAIGALAADRRLMAVVAEGATTRMADDQAWLSEEYGWRGAVQERLSWIMYGLTDVLTSADPPAPLRDSVQAAASRPVLLIAGGALPDEVRAAEHIQAGSPDGVEIWVAPGSGHTDALADHPDEWIERVDALLAAADPAVYAVNPTNGGDVAGGGT